MNQKNIFPKKNSLPEVLQSIFFNNSHTFFAHPHFVILTDEPENTRLDYVCYFIFTMEFQCFYSISGYQSNISIKDNAILLEYSPEQRHPAAIHIFSDGWLKQTTMPEKKTNDYYYIPSATGFLQKDFFSYTFFHLSRYEEWIGFKPDIHGRFDAAQSGMALHGFHEIPFLHTGLELFKKHLEEKSGIHISSARNRSFKKLLTVDVDNGFAYLGKGILRTTGAFARDLIHKKWKNVTERAEVLLKKKNDPFDVYETLYRISKEHQVPLLYFVLLSDKKPYNRFLKQGSRYRNLLACRLKEFSDIFPGLHPSYESMADSTVMEKEWMEHFILFGTGPRISRQHYLRFDIRITPGILLEHKVVADFSIGFASTQGFRAGTWSPFPYFNFKRNCAEPLWLVPFCTMDGNYFVYDRLDASQAWEKFRRILSQIKEKQGVACMVFHERTLSNHIVQKYTELLQNFLSF